MHHSFADPLSGLGRLHRTLPLVGRENELQMIRSLLTTVSSGLSGAHALHLSGEMGVGKSRLLAEVYQEARAQGFQVLESSAYETSSMIPYFPFIGVLRQIFHHSSRQRLRQYAGIDGQGENDTMSLIGIPLVTSLARILPEVPEVLNVRIDPAVTAPDQEKFRLLDAVATLLERMAQEQPVLLGIDSLQWADSASLELVMYLTIRLHHSRVALVGTTRPPGRQLEGREDHMRVDTPTANQAATRMLAELIGQGVLFFLPLAPLDRRAAAEHLQAL
ncbi:MAG: AAA family ATPase, partial [Ktedonobacteraceae bacterium]|nr:AAA family ATPase [Ktedonobacteraceae bacterium]